MEGNGIDSWYSSFFTSSPSITSAYWRTSFSSLSHLNRGKEWKSSDYQMVHHEGLLFLSFFWTSFHSLSSPSLGIWPGEGFYVHSLGISCESSQMDFSTCSRQPPCVSFSISLDSNNKRIMKRKSKMKMKFLNL